MGVTRSVVRREMVLLVLLVAVATAAFFVTRTVAANSRRVRLSDAAAWAARAQRALDDDRRADAIDALRHAAALDRNDSTYQLTLARALADDGNAAAARQVLLGLRGVAPEEPAVNLQLARLSAGLGDIVDAVRYYQNALYGVWTPEEEERRREIRVELIRFLLEYGEDSRALSELLVLNANLPNDTDAEVEVARLFLEAGEFGRALEGYTRALQDAPDDPRALAGAGEAAFALGEYTRARTYFRRAPADAGRGAELAPLADLVLNADPLAPRLASAERRRRLTTAFEQAARRLDACLGGTSSAQASLQALDTEAKAFAEAVAAGALRQSSDAIDAGFDLAFRIEGATQAGCGPADPLDRAIILIGRRHGLDAS